MLNGLIATAAYEEEAERNLIPAVEFNIGKSTKLVHLDKFYIDKTEVTQKEFKKIMRPSIFSLKEKVTPRNK